MAVSLHLHNLESACLSLELQISAPAFVRPGGGLGDEDGMDMAVFRFTLGIPGFEDRYIPRVVGGLGASLVLLNHFLAVQAAPPSQVSRLGVGRLHECRGCVKKYLHLK